MLEGQTNTETVQTVPVLRAFQDKSSEFHKISSSTNERNLLGLRAVLARAKNSVSFKSATQGRVGQRNMTKLNGGRLQTGMARLNHVGKGGTLAELWPSALYDLV